VVGASSRTVQPVSMPSACSLHQPVAQEPLRHGAEEGHRLRQPREPVIGLITKTETNPFFVKMKEGAAGRRQGQGRQAAVGAGKTDGDNAGQVTAMENMIAAGAKTILITPSDSKAILPPSRRRRTRA
jgi:ABC-type sugar transport system substrate-binding protein